MRISVSLLFIIFYCPGLQIAHADASVRDGSSCGELQGTLSDEIKPNWSSCSEDLKCDTGTAFDKNVSTVTIASPNAHHISWITFKFDKVYSISEIKVLLCKGGQNGLTIDTYMKMNHLERVAKVQSRQNSKEQIFRPTSLADKIMITNYINKKIVISEMIILGMAACELPKNVWINVTHSYETNPNNGDTVKFEYTDTSGDVVCISANCYKGTYRNVTRCDTTTTVCLPLQTTDNEALRASLEILMSRFPIDVGKLDHNGRSGYVKTTIICHDNGTLSSPQSFIDLQTQNFFYAISDTGGTISPSIATEAMCLLIDANRIFDVLEDDEVDELTMEYYALTLHDAAGKEICGVNITKYSIQMREVTILDKTYPASELCGETNRTINVDLDGNNLKLRFEFIDGDEIFSCNLSHFDSGDKSLLASKLITKNEINLSITGSVVETNGDNYTVLDKIFTCQYKGDLADVTIDQQEIHRITKQFNGAMGEKGSLKCNFIFGADGDLVLKEFSYTIERSDITFYECAGGSVLDTDAGECNPCQQGEYKLNGACAPCPDSQYADFGSTQCHECINGIIGENKDSCYHCPLGKIVENNKCKTCGYGTFQNGSECFDCPDYNYSMMGWTECFSCPMGFEINEDKSGCNPCQPDTYMNKTKTSNCTACSKGYSTRGFYAQTQCTEDQRQTPVCKQVVEQYKAIGDITFEVTLSGSIVSAKCPYNDKSVATRVCREDGTWEEPNLSACNSKITKRIEEVEISETILDEIIDLTNNEKSVGPKDIGILIEIFANADFFTSITEWEAAYDLTNQNLLVMSNLMAASNYTSTDQVVKNDIIYTTEKILGESLQHMENESNMSFKTGMVDVDLVQNASSAPLAVGENSITFSTNIGKLAALKYKDTSLFLPDPHGNVVSGDVIGLSEPVTEGKTTDIKLAIKFKRTEVPSDSDSSKVVTRECKFYNTNTNLWSTQGCTTKIDNDGSIVCECSHMTSFAVILSVSESMTVMWLSDLVLGINIFFCLLTLLATLPFRVFRVMKMTVLRSHTIINLVCLCIAWYCMHMDFHGVPNQSSACQVVAFIAHYFLISYFSWVCCCTLMLKSQIVDALKSYGRNDDKLITKCVLFSYGFPLLLPSIAILADYLIQREYTDTEYDIPMSYIRLEECWYDEIWMYIFILVPIYVFIALNLGVFVRIIRFLAKAKGATGSADKMKILKTGFALAFTQGLPWIIHPGALAGKTEATVFQYLFLISFGLQGPGIFLFNVLLQEEVKKNIVRVFNTTFLNKVESKKSSNSAQSKQTHVSATSSRQNEEKCYSNTLALNNLKTLDDDTMEENAIHFSFEDLDKIGSVQVTKNLYENHVTRAVLQSSGDVFVPAEVKIKFMGGSRIYQTTPTQSAGKISPMPGQIEPSDHTGPPLL